MFSHAPVLLNESISALSIKADGIYIDCTLGRAGHSSHILSKLGPNGRLICFDKDISAIEYAREKFGDDSRVLLVQESFAALNDVLERENLSGKVDGILFDLGVSSPQLDDAARGFSFMKEGPLDMRMNQNQEQSAATWLASASIEEITEVLKRYGQERFAKRIATEIVNKREENPIDTTQKLVSLVKKASPFVDKHKHPATRTFQAIRIKVNNELDDLKVALESAINNLVTGGILAVISFHSLEDTIVKNVLRDAATVDIPINIPIKQEELEKLKKLKVNKKLKPSQDEIDTNVRARSAILRTAIRL